MDQGEDKYYLETNFQGYGYRGDQVEVVRKNGDLALVKNGNKKFCVDKKHLKKWPVHQQQAAQKSQSLTVK